MENLTDLEISIRLAKIEGLEVATPREAISRDWNEDACIILPHGKYAGGSYPYLPLIDDTVCFLLMIKHGVLVRHFYEDDVLICTAEDMFGNVLGKPIFAPAGSDLAAIKRCACIGIIIIKE